MDATKIKLAICDQFMTTADEELGQIYNGDESRKAGEELCHDICALFASGLFEVKICLIGQDGELKVMRLKHEGKKELESLGFFAPCFAAALAEEDVEVHDIKLPGGKVIQVKKPQKVRPVAQLPYEKVVILHELDAAYRTMLTLNEQHTDAELANKFSDISMLAMKLPHMLPMYLAMQFDGKMECVKGLVATHAQGDTIVLDEAWVARFLSADADNI